MRGTCDSCKHFQKDGSYAIPNPPDIPGDNSWRTGPHCTYNPKWVGIRDPKDHFCAHWEEKEE